MTGRGDGGRRWLGYLLVGLAAIVCYYLVPAHAGGQAVRVILYCAVSISAAVAIGYAVRRGWARPRLPWLLLGASQLVYAVGDCTFYFEQYILRSASFPSVADIFYVATYPIYVAGLLVLIRHRARRRDLAAVTDAAIIAVVAGMLSWLYLISPMTQLGSSVLATLASSAYPVLDLAVLAVGLRLVLGTGRRPVAFFLLLGNLTLVLVADTIYADQQLTGTYHSGNFLDGFWLVADLLLGAAALHPTLGQLGRPAQDHDTSLRPARIVVLCGAALIAPAAMLGEYLRGQLGEVLPIAVFCAVLFVLVILRMAGLVADQRRLAVTDPLTGLHTRRFLENQLPLELARARRVGTPLAVLIVDVDHFKAVNDRYGHPAGDRALQEIARRLRTETRAGDVLARYGGEEFAVLAPNIGTTEVSGLAVRLRRCVSSHPVTVSGDSTVTVTVSAGTASYPVHGGSPGALVEVADRALYSAKSLGRDTIVVGGIYEPELAPPDTEQGAMVEYLCRLADEVDGDLSTREHSRAIGRWAALVAAEMGLEQQAIRRAALAGRLHDIGKIVIPKAVLGKPSALSGAEWKLMHEHPDHGYRLARAVPGLEETAKVIRQHHERYDGSGYPEGLARTEICPEARILTVCDSWATMLSDRPYQETRTAQEAGAELRRFQGRQFDPAVVEAFLRLRDSGLIGELESLRPRRVPPSMSIQDTLRS